LLKQLVHLELTDASEPSRRSIKTRTLFELEPQGSSDLPLRRLSGSPGGTTCRGRAGGLATLARDDLSADPLVSADPPAASVWRLIPCEFAPAPRAEHFHELHATLQLEDLARSPELVVEVVHEFAWPTPDPTQGDSGSFWLAPLPHVPWTLARGPTAYALELSLRLPPGDRLRSAMPSLLREEPALRSPPETDEGALFYSARLPAPLRFVRLEVVARRARHFGWEEFSEAVVIFAGLVGFALLLRALLQPGKRSTGASS
jgi:hypothetical protein